MKRDVGTYLFNASDSVDTGSGYTPVAPGSVAAFFDADGAEVRVSLNREGTIEVYYTTNAPNRYLVVRPTSSNTCEIRTAEL